MYWSRNCPDNWFCILDCLLIGIARTFDLECSLRIEIARTIDLGDCQLIGIGGTNNFGGSLLIEIVRTTNSGRRLSIGVVGTIDSGDGLSIGIVRTIFIGEGPLIGIVRTIDHGDYLSNNGVVWTIGTRRGHPIDIVWKIELYALRLAGNRNHNRQSINYCNRKLLRDIWTAVCCLLSRVWSYTYIYVYLDTNITTTSIHQAAINCVHFQREWNKWNGACQAQVICKCITQDEWHDKTPVRRRIMIMMMNHAGYFYIEPIELPWYSTFKHISYTSIFYISSVRRCEAGLTDPSW